jgi:3',5'-cyclic AMP phosphodiesterase CpdA
MIYHLLADGTAPHDRLAPYLFEAFLERITTGDAEWNALPTWLICTGDITTFGDRASLDEGKIWLKRFERYVQRTLWLHGNHDEWPNTVPLLASPAEIESHHMQLEKDRSSWPTNPLREPFKDSKGQLVGEVQLYGLNSVLHSAWQNTWARGEIARSSLQALATCIDRAIKPDNARHLRILATHHPIHYPNRPTYQMVMRNDKDVAIQLERGSPAGIRPLVHLVLSGHTHAYFQNSKSYLSVRKNVNILT